MARITKPLNNTEITRAKPRNKDYTLVDGKGLFLKIKPTGSKTWIFNYYKPNDGKRTNTKIGRFPDVSLAQAREKAEEYRALLAQDIDPQLHEKQEAIKKEQINNNTFLAIAQKWKEKKKGEITDKTLSKYWRSLELHILPFIGAYPISEIVPTLVIIPLKRVEERNNIDMAQRLASYINEILNYAVNGGLIPFNPCLRINKNLKRNTKTNNPHIKTEEIPEFMKAIDQAKIQEQTKIALLLKILTMVRSNELCGAKWKEIDLNTQVWTIPAERMKASKEHKVPLSNQAIKLLIQLKTITGRFTYLFPKRGNNNEYMHPDSLNMAIKRMGYQGMQTAHGLRGLARTFLAENNVQHEHAESCLAHATGSQVSQAYNHANYLEQRKNIMQQWADFIEESATGTNLFK